MPWRQEVYLEVYSTFFPVLSWFHLALLELKSAKNAFIFLESYQLSWCFSLLPIIWTSFFLDFLSCYCSLIIAVACLPAVFVLFSYVFCWFFSLCVHLIYSFLSCFLFSFHVAFFSPTNFHPNSLQHANVPFNFKTCYRNYERFKSKQIYVNALVFLFL